MFGTLSFALENSKTIMSACTPLSNVEVNPANMPIWISYGLPIKGVQPGSAWVPNGLAHMRVAQKGPIWVPYNSPIKKKEMI